MVKMYLHFHMYLVLLTLVNLSIDASQSGLQCFVPGQCLDSTMLAISKTETAKGDINLEILFLLFS